MHSKMSVGRYLSTFMYFSIRNYLAYFSLIIILYFSLIIILYFSLIIVIFLLTILFIV